MASYRSGLLTPPREEEERKLHRPVWRSVIIENAALAGVMGGLYVIQAIVGIAIPVRLQLPVNLLISILPVLLWLGLSVMAERAYPQPRLRLWGVGAIAALVARAIGDPFVADVLQISEWLPLSSAINRIIGYTFTVGIVECALCYVVVRTLTFPDHLRDRYDTIAYGAAAAVGYTVVANVEFALAGQSPAYVVALNTFANVSILTLSMLFIGYGLSGTLFDGGHALLQPVTLAVSAFVIGVALPLRGGFLNASFSVKSILLPRYIFGIGFSIGLFVGGVFVLHFLFRFAERQAAERQAGEAF